MISAPSARTMTAETPRRSSALAPPQEPSFIRKHPVLIYYVLTFTISCGAVLLLVGGPANVPGTSQQVAALFPIALLAMLGGPSVAGILLTGLVSGRAGYRDMISRLLRWRVGTMWHAVALLTFPVLATIVLSALSLTSSVYLPAIVTAGDKVALVLTGIAVGLGYGLGEELGWTGFAIPRLRLHHSVLTTGLIVGFLWGAWHVPVTFWASGDASGVFAPAVFLPPLVFYVGVLPAYRMLMVWVYDRTASLLVATLMHASLIVFSLFVLIPPTAALVTYYLVLTPVIWTAVAAVTVVERFARMNFRRSW